MGTISTWWYGDGKFFKDQLFFGALGLVISLIATFVILYFEIPLETRTSPLGLLYAVAGIFGVVSLIGLFIFTRRAVLVVRAIRRFRRAFGFLPPTTPEGRGALQPKVVQALNRKRQVLNEIYQDESRLLGELKKEGLTAQQVHELEREIRQRKPDKKFFRKVFYGARDAAKSKYLPEPFEVKDFEG